MHRPSKRMPDQLRQVLLTPSVSNKAEGSCHAKFGGTEVRITATVEDKTPPWLKGKGKGWITAEYAMLPRSTHERVRREVTNGKPSGRTQEIQRLIGRSLRSIVDLNAIGERQIILDCDVIEADGGTRTASITGAYIALFEALKKMEKNGQLLRWPLNDHVAAISCGIYRDIPVLDLDYDEDSVAEVDANFIITGNGDLVEIQATGEERPFKQHEFEALLNLALKGTRELIELQKQAEQIITEQLT